MVDGGRRAVVVGGGIGGLTAAVALHRAGWQVRVFERAESLEPVGAGISLWPNAVKALGALGLGAPLAGLVTIAGPTGVRRPDGRWLARTDVGNGVRKRFGAPLVVLHRAELVDLLARAVPSDAITTGTTVTGVANRDDGLILHTTDGDVTAHLVVAADGIRSVLREASFASPPRPSYAGYTAWRMVVPALEPELTGFETWGGSGERFAAVPMSGGRWYCYATAKVPPGTQYADDQAELIRRFGTWHGPIPRILTTVSPDTVLHQDVEYLAAPLPAMHAGHVAFVGDSAHAMTPDLGQGGCMAVEDAVVLASCLRDTAIEDALTAYSSQRLPRTTAVARRSRRAGRLYQSPYAVQLLTARLMGLIPTALVARGLEPTVGWDPPAAAP